MDSGTINTQHFLIGHDGRAVDGAQLVLKGASPQLQVRGEAKVSVTTSAGAAVCFVLPEDGFARTPILKAGSNGLAFMDNGDSAQKVSFVIDRASPFYDQDKAELSQLLVDWTRNGSAYAIDTEAIALVAPRGANPGFRYDPATGETKCKLFVDLKKTLGLAVVVR